MKEQKKTPRRTISEILTRYKMFPHFREIYVEGSTDVKVFQAFLREFGFNDVVVYSIDVIDVPINESLFLDHLPGDGGCKERVVTLAFELEKACKGICKQAICIADAGL